MNNKDMAVLKTALKNINKLIARTKDDEAVTRLMNARNELINITGNTQDKTYEEEKTEPVKDNW